MESLESILPDNSITSHINLADAIQRSIERETTNLVDLRFFGLGEILNSILAEEEIASKHPQTNGTCNGNFRASAMLHTDFEFEQVCEWLDDGRRPHPSGIQHSSG